MLGEMTRKEEEDDETVVIRTQRANARTRNRDDDDDDDDDADVFARIRGYRVDVGRIREDGKRRDGRSGRCDFTVRAEEVLRDVDDGEERQRRRIV